MKRKRMGLIGLLVAGALALCIGAVATQQIAEQEKEVPIDQVPAAVKTTMLAQGGTGAIEEVDLVNENGQIIYETDLIIDGHEVEIQVAPDGTLLGKKAEEEDEDENQADDKDD
jgi:hypothetical protein